MHDKIISIVSNNENITWQNMILELIKNENMDPWDLDISKLARKFIKIIKRMKELDLFVGGKMLLAAAYLLKIKSVSLIDDYISEFDKMIAESEEDNFIGDFYEELENDWNEEIEYKKEELPEGLVPRTPQPRKRKVSVYDLMEALQKAIEVSERKALREMKVPKVKIPEKKRDVSEVIKELYSRIVDIFKRKKRLTFSELIPSNSKEDIVQTFIPLLHMSNRSYNKVDLIQKEPFQEIEIKLVN